MLIDILICSFCIIDIISDVIDIIDFITDIVEVRTGPYLRYPPLLFTTGVNVYS